MLRRRLRGAFRGASNDLITDAAEDAIVEYGLRPSVFDPSRCVPLDRFLYLAAWRNLANSLDAEARRRTREATYAQAQAAGPETVELSRSDVEPDMNAIRQVLGAVSSDAESKGLCLWLGGERRTAPLASVMGLDHLSVSEQRREVKRFKDRTLKRLARLTAKRPAPTTQTASD